LIANVIIDKAEIQYAIDASKDAHRHLRELKKQPGVNGNTAEMESSTTGRSGVENMVCTSTGFIKPYHLYKNIRPKLINGRVSEGCN
jgi:hypothetical protein